MFKNICKELKQILLLLKRSGHFDDVMLVMLESITYLETNIHKDSQEIDSEESLFQQQRFYLLLLPSVQKVCVLIENITKENPKDEYQEILSELQSFEKAWKTNFSVIGTASAFFKNKDQNIFPNTLQRTLTVTNQILNRELQVSCSVCFTQIPISFMFCGNCGTKLYSNQETQVDKSSLEVDDIVPDEVQQEHDRRREDRIFDIQDKNMEFHTEFDRDVFDGGRSVDFQSEYHKSSRDGEQKFEEVVLMHSISLEPSKLTDAASLFKDFMEARTKSKNFEILRSVQVVAPKSVSLKEKFTVTVFFAKEEKDLLPSSNQEQETCASIAFTATEEYPVVHVMIRTSDFEILSSSCQQLPLGFREVDKVKFHVGQIPDLQHMSQGELSIDILYKDTLLYSCDILIPIDTSQKIFQKKEILALQNVFVIDQEEQEIEAFLSQNNCDIENLPFILQLSYREIIERESYFEKASSIPHALENFLIYHLSVAMADEEDVPWAKQKGNVTLGLQRNYFETILQSKKWKRRVLEKIPYLHQFQQPLMKEIISQIIYYRNRFWGHNYRVPTKEQCKLLFECFIKKIQVLFFTIYETFPHFLFVVNENTTIKTYPSNPSLSSEYQSLPTGVYWSMGGRQPIKIMMAVEQCHVCHQEHLVYKMGKLEKQRPVLGLCGL